MKYKEVSEKKGDELEALETKLRKELSDLRLRAFAGQLKETAKLGSLKRDIARVLTHKKARN